jgi:predicted nucleotidyltransferase
LDADGVTVWHEQEAIRRLVLEAFEDCDADVFLFGSRASGAARERSDYDVGFLAGAALPSERFADLRERLEELPIPSHVELVDFRGVSDKFSATVLERRDLQVWKRRQTNSLFTSTS